MPDSIREQILKKIATKLATITTGGGYGNTIASVQRFSVAGQVSASTPYIVIHEGDESPQEEPDPATYYELALELEVRTAHDTAADARTSEELANSLRADIRKAMMSNRGWDGLAIDTKPLGSTGVFVLEGESEFLFVMDTTIIYRHLYSDPAVAI